MDEIQGWARQTFGEARLGNVSRVRRLIGMAATLAQRPAGTVTAVFGDAAEREGAFRLLSSKHVRPEAVVDAVAGATLRKCRGRVYCAIDGSSLTLTDRLQSRDVGRVGTTKAKARGLQALTALMADANGVPIGLAGVHFWARTGPSLREGRRNHPDVKGVGEMRHTLAFVTHLDDMRRTHASHVEPWYQLDRGFDSGALFRLAAARGLLVTVRASVERRLEAPGGKRRYLRAAVRRAPALGDVLVEVPARHGEPARLAVVRVRATTVRLSLPVTHRKRSTVEVTAVQAKEVGYSGPGALHWTLLTTASATTLAEARAVLDGYALRWRIEDMHRAWKAGWCNVEQTQLRSRAAIIKWATLHLAVATRAMRLAHLARTEPDRPSTDELSRDEVDAVLILASKRKRTKYKRGETPPLGELVDLLARLGGYVGKSSGGPPGATVVGRGLDRIAALAEGLALMKET
jgi:hypothetical protein